jgi:hypothetical protein
MATTAHSVLLVCLLAATLTAQGSDDCASAQPIAGTGLFHYDTGPATSSGPLEAFAPLPGLDSAYNDVWFSWEAPTTGVYEFSTCFPQWQWAATFVAVYESDCPTAHGRAVVARGAYDCGLFTTFELGTTAGQTYLIRLGHSHSSLKDDGQFQITQVDAPAILDGAINPANGHAYHFLEPSSWSVAQAAARKLGGHLVTVNDQDENAWLDATFSNWGGEARSFWLGYNDAAIEGTWEWVSGETPGYTNWTGAPNNGSQSEHYAHFRYDHEDGTWNDLVGFPGQSYFYNTLHGVVEVGEGDGHYFVEQGLDGGYNPWVKGQVVTPGIGVVPDPGEVDTLALTSATFHRSADGWGGPTSRLYLNLYDDDPVNGTGQFVGSSLESIDVALLDNLDPIPWTFDHLTLDVDQPYWALVSTTATAGGLDVWCGMRESGASDPYAGGDSVTGIPGDQGGFHLKPTIDLAFAFELVLSAFADLGGGVAGTHGASALVASGSLEGGSTVTLDASPLLPGSPCALVLGLSQAGVPFKGGTLVPFPDVVVWLATNAGGELSLTTTWPTGIPTDAQLFLQAWQSDPGAVAGWAATNGLVGTTP